MNDRLEDLLNGLSGRWPWLDALMKLLATDAIVLFAVALVALWLWPGPVSRRAARQRIALAAAAGALVGLAIGVLVGSLHPEARPFVTDHDTRLLIAHAADNGLPSDHALAVFGIAGTIIWWHRRIGAALLALSLLIGLSRIYVGVHWPGDIAAGALIGLLTGGLAAWTAPWWAAVQRWGSRILPPVLLAPP